MTDPRRPSQLITTPTGLTDPLLWRLAIDVAAAHQPDTSGRCTNLQCAGWRHGECPPARLARYALHRAYPTPSLRRLPALITRTATPRSASPPSTATGHTSPAGYSAATRASTPRPRPHLIPTAA